ncbi:hypothetical protein [Lacticaseibacillus saniviri]|uniref:Uncharacterized protein n=1 Tax=Lacticaseibacillus saniviri JCM 17471 = DSM 24301 TaxID=1293598 RepID=A0A0R2MVT1_9LACO|nr:hypothetical protein [Lacticaseibacillus saniviri]KRO15917.1 hypothetical protein IV56_GL002108 [Lacticaseibacillus saniviri JCM 17471 = DSM 24301]
MTTHHFLSGKYLITIEKSDNILVETRLLVSKDKRLIDQHYLARMDKLIEKYGMPLEPIHIDTFKD